MRDIQKWLADLGLSQYSQAFSENLIDFEVLPLRCGQPKQSVGS